MSRAKPVRRVLTEPPPVTNHPVISSMSTLGFKAATLKLASDVDRLMILEILRDGEQSVRDICEALGGKSKKVISNNMTLLKLGRLVEVRRQSRLCFYKLSTVGRHVLQLADRLATDS